MSESAGDTPLQRDERRRSLLTTLCDTAVDLFSVRSLPVSLVELDDLVVQVLLVGDVLLHL